MFEVYSKANCAQCDMLKNQMKQAGIEFEEVRVDQDPEARGFLLAEGHRSVPQVYSPEGRYIGSKFSDVKKG